MTSPEESFEKRFIGDPYLQPSNVHTREDGTVVAYGPHGMEFILSAAERAVIEGIEGGFIPAYGQTIEAASAPADGEFAS